MIRYRRGCKLALVLLLFATAWSSPAAGQSLTRGGVDGVVRGPDGVALAGTSVILRDLSTGSAQSVTTTRTGRFRFSLLLPGEYELLAERFGSRPRRIAGIAVAPGRRIDLLLEMTPDGGTGAAADTMRDVGAGFATLAVGGVRLSAAQLRDLPEEQRELSGVSRLTSVSGPNLEMQGLPGYLSGVVVDGMPVTVARTPLPMGTLFGATHLTVNGFDGVELATTGLDVELPGKSGGLLSGYTRRGTRDLRVEPFATAGAQASSAQGVFRRAGEREDAGGGVVITGPISPDVASFSIGAEVWVAEIDPLAAALSDSLALEVSTISAGTFGVPLPDLSQPATRTGALSGFGRVDWQVAPEHSVSARANFGLFERARDGVSAGPASVADTRFDGGQLSAGAEVISRLGEGLTQSIRLGFELVDREYLPARRLLLPDLRDQSLTTTRILGDDWSYTLATGFGGTFRQALVRASETLSYETDRHVLKGGLAISLGSYDFDSDQDGWGEFLFSGLDDFAGRRGAFVQTLGGGAQAEFTLPQFAGFFQDEWRAAPGLELLAGIRYDLEAFPRGEVVVDEEWLARSGIDTLAYDATVGRASPRVGFRWDPGLEGRWLMTGTLGLYSESMDPALLAAVLAGGNPVTVRRGYGDLSSWPVLPDSTTAPVLGSRLSLLAPGFAGPRTLRGSFGIARRLWEGASLRVSVDYRHTDVLPRTRDLNLLPLPIAHDQHGRPVYGRLRQQGSLLLAEVGSNRRFPGFDQVVATDVDGSSTFRGVTVAAGHESRGGLNLLASYTYSRTTDNWPRGPLGGPELPAFPDPRDPGEWAEGTSDLDVPHRVAVFTGGHLPGAPALRFGALYRFRSGYPFTPGFPAGVDPNGDGSDGNDPAYVDADIPGTDALLAAWPCLRSASGALAARNACRAPDVHTLDVRLGLQLVRSRRYTLTLQGDALDVLDMQRATIDRALYLIDDTRALATDAATGVVTIPLRANESFGRTVRPAYAGRLFRLGLRLDH